MKDLRRIFFRGHLTRAFEILLFISILAMLFLILFMNVQYNDHASAGTSKMNYRLFGGLHA